MHLILDHMFIMVAPGAHVANSLSAIGMVEGSSNSHPGQGTANRRFYFDNGMLELLYIRDSEEARKGPARDLHFVERTTLPEASPFGLIIHAGQESEKLRPFDGWTYQPEYFPKGWGFHVANNSSNVCEPLCIFVPFYNAELKPEKPGGGEFVTITKVIITTPSISQTLSIMNSVEGLSIEEGDEHLMSLEFNHGKKGDRKDMRPDIPLIVNW